MRIVSSLPAPARPAPPLRFRLGQPVLTPDNRVAILCGSCVTPRGLMAFVVDAATPARQRRSRMVAYADLRAAPDGGPRLAIDNGNRRNPFAGLDRNDAQPMRAAPDAPQLAVAHPAEDLRAVTRSACDVLQIPAFLRAAWPRDRDGLRLRPYEPRVAVLALLAFRLWPAMAARRFDAARLVESARTGALLCGPGDQALLARIASTRAQA